MDEELNFPSGYTLGASSTTVWYEAAIASAYSIHSKCRDAYFPGALADPAKEATVPGRNADPGPDGIASLLEYNLVLDPLRPSVAGLPPISSMTKPADARDYLTMTYSLRAAVGDVAVAPEICSDLETWRSGPSALEVASDTTAAGVRAIVVHDIQPLNVVQRRFHPLHVATP